jgi:hypothetical protein
MANAKTELIEAKLVQDPETSNRAIGTALGVNDKLVGTVRRELEKKERIPVVTHTRGADGRLRQRKRKHPPPVTSGRGTVLPFLASYSPRRSSAEKTSDSVLGQIRAALTSHPLAFLVALPFGGFVPLAAWSLVHLEALEWWHWTMVAGGALFSSLTVINWGERILSSKAKAIGFAVLVEGVMLSASTKWLSLSALGLLIVINAVSCSVALAADDS